MPRQLGAQAPEAGGKSPAKVTKETTGFTISGFVPDDQDNCKLADGTTEEEILKGDRKELCE